MKIETFQAMGIKEKGVVVLLELPVCKNSFPAPTHAPPIPSLEMGNEKEMAFKDIARAGCLVSHRNS